MARFFRAASSNVPAVVVLLHPGRAAMTAAEAPASDRWRSFATVAEDVGVPALPMDAVLDGWGEAYGDGVHINAAGQRSTPTR